MSESDSSSDWDTAELLDHIDLVTAQYCKEKELGNANCGTTVEVSKESLNTRGSLPSTSTSDTSTSLDAAELGCNTDFGFPFENPYSIQIDLMREITKVLVEGKCGIFESPTGTGKSLSLICSVLTWLLSHREAEQTAAQQRVQKNREPELAPGQPDDWLNEGYYRRKAEQEGKEAAIKTVKRYASRTEHFCTIRKRLKEFDKTGVSHMFGFQNGPASRKRRADPKDDISSTEHLVEQPHADEHGLDLDEDLVLEDYDSDSDVRSGITSRGKSHRLRAGSVVEGDFTEDGPEDEDKHLQIFYCSRTHSQLSQFVGELRKTRFVSEIAMVMLGSRQSYCINQSVRGLSSLSLMNDKCLDMQRGRSQKENKKRGGAAGKCPYYQKVPIDYFSDRLLVELHDIEEAVQKGKESKACPYYASRHGVNWADLVLMPYQMLFHRSTREASGINLKNSVIIIDEAHNLIDAINAVHSIIISNDSVHLAFSQLQQYAERYRSRLKAKNLLYVRQLLDLLRNLMRFFEAKLPKSDRKAQQPLDLVFTVPDFVFDARIDHFNAFKLLNYMRVSQISRKVSGFAQRQQAIVENQLSGQDSVLCPNPGDQRTSGSSGMLSVESLLESLCNSTKDGRFVLTVGSGSKPGSSSKVILKFILLNPMAHFHDIVLQARSVILAGGTMAPVDDVRSCLVPEPISTTDATSATEVHTFSCDHVISSGQIYPAILTHSANGRCFDFSYDNRGDVDLRTEFGNVLLSVCQQIRGGIVCFFPSYQFESSLYDLFERISLVNKLKQAGYPVYREPKLASHVDRVLGRYSEAVSCSRRSTVGGAVLFAIVGGKLSEGINFSDDLGRCVIMIGMPYPNVRSTELSERMRYLNSLSGVCDSNARSSNTPGQEYCENICLKAVNQSIGRVIRHAGDYATILLIDARYNRSSIIRKIPKWISSRLKVVDRCSAEFLASLKSFSDLNESRHASIAS